MIRSLTLLIATFLIGCSGQTAPVIDESKIQLTAEEQNYVKTHKVVTWAAEDNRPPFVYEEGNMVKGISVQHLNLISKKTGLQFKPVQVDSFLVGITAVKDGKIDLITAIRPSAKMMAYFKFTSPYVYNAGVYVFRLNNQPRSPLRAGICQGDAVYDYLLERFPDMKITQTQDNEEAMALLEKGLLDVVVMNEASADYLSKRSIIKMRKAGADFDYPFSFALRKENEVLNQIMSKAIASISVEEKKTINESWSKE